jgi:endo-beta-N-acetylglucosaminidase D
MSDLLRTNSEIKKHIDKTINKDDEGVNSISTEDAMIIIHLKYLTENGFPLVGEILSEWKTEATDQDIVDRLEDLVTLVEKSNKNGDGEETKKLIKVAGEYIFGHLIFSVGVSDGYNVDDIEFPMRYNIILNKTSNDKAMYANKELSFFSPLQRERSLKKLLANLEQFHNVTVIE